MSRRSLSAIAMVLALIAAGAWLYLNFERVTEREETGWQGEARRNSLLAAMRLFERMGLNARETRELAQLETLPAQATVILSRHRSQMSQQRVDALLRRVEAGAHLIIEAERFKDKDVLLDALEIRRSPVLRRDAKGPGAVTLPDVPQTLRVEFGYLQNLQPRRQPVIRFDDDPSGPYLVHEQRGKGQVTVVADMNFMRNDGIAKYDHAEFAWQLIQFLPESRTVLIVPSLEAPSLARWLLDNALAALAFAALLLVAYLWRVVPRFGPLTPDAQPARRRLLDHLRASGRFHWQRGGAQRLLTAARDACLRKIARSHPALADLPRVERAAQLAALTEFTGAQIDAALHDDVHQDALRFTSAIGVLQRMEEQLVRKLGN
jgi:hypothetical protein